MVFTCSEEEESMAMGPERSNSKPLHNFMLPCLKWGSQRHLRCTKLPSDAAADAAGDRRSPAPREFHSSPLSNAATRLPKPRNPEAENKTEEIRDMRVRLTLECKTETGMIKDAYLGKVVADDNDNDIRMEEAPPPPPPPMPPAEEAPNGGRTWNLRTRRAPVAEKGVRIDERRGGSSSTPSPLRTQVIPWKSPKLRRSPEKEERPVKFSLTLSKKEIEEDFMKIVGHRPPRRPKRRPRNVQKQLDTLFPGQWLSEVSADSYKVPEVAEIGKR